MLFKEWLGRAEEKLEGIIPKKQPRCLIALEDNQIIALVVICPNNRRGSSWTISSPEFLNNPKAITRRQISQYLIQRVISQKSTNSQAWLIKSPIDDREMLSISRELGFQPLKKTNCWTLNKLNLNKFLSKKQPIYPKNITWQKLAKTNASSLLRLKQVNESVQLRQLLDIQSVDLLDKSNKRSGVLICTYKNQISEIAGLINNTSSTDYNSYELVKDIAWDTRLNESIPAMIKELIRDQPDIILNINSDDEKLNHIVCDMGLEKIDELVILGRSLWKRKISHNLLGKESSLETVLDRLNPQHKPIPSPTVNR